MSLLFDGIYRITGDSQDCWLACLQGSQVSLQNKHEGCWGDKRRAETEVFKGFVREYATRCTTSVTQSELVCGQSSRELCHLLAALTLKRSLERLLGGKRGVL